ncbi:MAG: hypothetical protein QNJ12_17615 [Ilumatobacter sp.]|uniref:hypothetical protein n=1 Tax=Ilumatobacter sp. TaxID=1967498 RepID=UPI002638DE92|nr:hypothetical protein [Ilumatobacter sp.]MDJ0770616.1 hypothetical protein [Ilumatobacter sp.]
MTQRFAQQALADGFQIGNMIPTVIDDDVDTARARNRTTLRGYVALPNHRGARGR